MMHSTTQRPDDPFANTYTYYVDDDKQANGVRARSEDVLSDTAQGDVNNVDKESR